MKKQVLFVCTHNSARSQMAEALLRHFWGDRYDAFSAGTRPYQVNPYAIQAAENLGIGMEGHRSKSVEEMLDKEFDYIITVCDHAQENCPYIPGGKRYLHHSFSDPAMREGTADEILAEFARVRDEIRDWLARTIASGEL